MRQIIYILGDVHGQFGKLNDFIDARVRKNRALEYAARDGGLEVDVFQVGDLGYFWPRFDGRGKIDNRISFLEGGRLKFYWCGGNHDDWDQIDALFSGGAAIAETEPGIYCCNFGAPVALINGETALFCGGAESIDKDWRLAEMRRGAEKIWWPQEGVSRNDVESLAAVPKAEIILSHTAPMLFNLSPWLAGNGFKPKKEDNASRELLNEVYLKYRPKKWFFGHFHERMRGRFEKCEWFGLSDMKYELDCWTSLDIRGQP